MLQSLESQPQYTISTLLDVPLNSSCAQDPGPLATQLPGSPRFSITSYIGIAVMLLPVLFHCEHDSDGTCTRLMLVAETTLGLLYSPPGHQSELSIHSSLLVVDEVLADWHWSSVSVSPSAHWSHEDEQLNRRKYCEFGVIER